ncbi:MAG: mechanosensitive ion channel domain-containing protein [Thauera sp.]
MKQKLMACLAFVFALALSGLVTPAAHAAESTAAPAAAESGHQRLADLLEDEAARSALIEQLRKLGEQDAAEAIAAGSAEPSLAARVADLSQRVAEGAVSETRNAVTAFGDAWHRLLAADPLALAWLVGEFAALVVVTLMVFRLLSAAAGTLFRALDRQAARGDGLSAVVWLRRVLSIGGAAATDLATVVLAWFAGHALALAALGAPGELQVQESLFLNAFLVVECLRAALRILVAHHGEHLRILPVAAEEKAYWYAWASRMVFFLGYGLLLVVPLINDLVTAELGRAAAVVILLTALLRAAVIVMQNRLRARAALDALAERMESSFARISLGIGARIWHVVALVYLAAILVTAILYPEEALPFMLAATGQTLIAVAAGIVLAALLTQVILRRIRIGDELRAKFPLLEARLNAYVPSALKIARFAILAVVVAVIIDAWTPFDLGVWMSSEAGARLLGRALSVALIILLALVVWLVLASWIEFRLNPQAGVAPNPRARTLLTIFRNVVAIALVVVTSMVVLAEIGINIAPLLAGAGVLGLAIGFGAQKLVQDVITGVFIQLERAIDVGDVVTAGGITGTVERLTIRSLGLRDLSGTYHLLPFSSVDTVANYNRDFAYHVGEYGIGYREDTDEAIVHLRAAFDELLQDAALRAQIIGDQLEVHGVTALADSSVNIRVRIKTMAGSQFPIGRAYNRLVKRHFDAAGIEIPFPHMTVYFGEDKQGKAPAAHLKLLGTGVGSAGPTTGPAPAQAG